MLIDVTMKTAEFDVWMRMLIYFGAAVSSSESCWGDDEQSSCLSFTAESSLTMLFYLWLGHNLDSEYRIDQNKLSVVIIKLILHTCLLICKGRKYIKRQLHLLQPSFKTANNVPSFFKLCPTVSVKERFFNTATKWYSTLVSHIVSIHQYTHTYITLFRVVGLESANINKWHIPVKCTTKNFELMPLWPT